jgi:L-ascorbate metabolism protein UlaG (beta-lactamase superfamily)
VTSVINAGFVIEHGDGTIAIDPVISPDAFERVALKEPERADAILITHSHWDHFDADSVVRFADRTSATVIASAGVIEQLTFASPRIRAIELEPTAEGSASSIQLNGINITAYRTHHSPDHNSYLVEFPGFRLFHDGDNENTRILDRAALRNLDVLMLCPWQGSDWVSFIEEVRPRHWLLMHMTDEEFDQYERGEFFRGICDRLPMDPVALRPGTYLEIQK